MNEHPQAAAGPQGPRARTRWILSGTVQGVGFRPFIHGLATDLGLTGWVRNSMEGLTVEAEGPPETLARFQSRLETEKPAHSVVSRMERVACAPENSACFEIKASDASAAPGTGVLPDLATCPRCVAEIFDPTNRRHLYPFTNCTGCGPRFTIVESLPYDRARTSMRHFQLCRKCREEYENPADRRFHAQPNACPECGPQLTFLDSHGRTRLHGHEALVETARQLAAGAVVAVKGLGGFHLLTLAEDAEAVRRLRAKKQRPDKPLAVMFPSLSEARRHCQISPLEEQQICSPAAPIVLVRSRRRLPREIAPGTSEIGALLPYTPLHHLLLAELGAPVVVTSANPPGPPSVSTKERRRLRCPAWPTHSWRISGPSSGMPMIPCSGSCRAAPCCSDAPADSPRHRSRCRARSRPPSHWAPPRKTVSHFPWGRGFSSANTSATWIPRGTARPANP
jgi:hydrogenase maturation protein HypF